MSTDTPAVRVERVLGETHTILVSLDPEQVLDALSWALKGSHISLTLLHSRDHAVRTIARQRLHRALSGTALQVALTPEEAEAIAEDITEAAVPAVPCVLGCGQLADSDYCGRCLDAGAGTVRRAV